MAMLGRRQHQGSAPFWITEDEKLGRTHFHSHLLRFPAVIDHGEDGDSLSFQDRLQLPQGFIDRMIAGLVNDSIGGHDRSPEANFLL